MGALYPVVLLLFGLCSHRVLEVCGRLCGVCVPFIVGVSDTECDYRILLAASNLHLNYKHV